ncbi:MAG TPA: hypothetical protein VHL85_10655, partial [Burkholderiales bacterium]|nr:hypothetical protein [Burkholderiales bacterium]
MRLSRNLIAAALAACSTAIFAQATTPGSPGAPAVGTQTSPGVLGPAPSSPGVVGGTFGTQPGVITTTPGATTTQPGISPNVYGSSMPGTASPGLATPGS